MAWSNPVGSVVEPSANGQTVAVPLSVSAGRLYVVALSFGGTTDPPPVTPPADFTWTQAVAPTRNSGQNLAIYYRVLTGAEGSTATFTVGAASVSYQAAVLYSDSTTGWGGTPLALVSSLATDSTLTTPSIANMPSSGGLAITCWSVSNGATGVSAGTPFWTSSDVTIVADAAQTATASRPVALGYEAAPAAGQTYPAQSASSAGLTVDTITAAMIFVEGAAGSAQTAILYAAGAPTPSGFDVTAEFADTALTNANMRLKTATDAAFTANVATHTSVTSVNAPTASPTYKIVKGTASGLSANTTYYYTWETWSGSAWVQTSGGNGKIKTRPANDTAASFVLAAASCSQHSAADDSAAFTQVDTLNPDYVMWLGDFYYENTIDRFSTDIERYRGDWREPLKDQPNRRTLLGNRGLLHAMGDHDGPGNGADATVAGWTQTHQAVREMIPQYTPHYSDVYTQSFQIGRVHFFILDAYSYRSPAVTTAGGYTNAQIDAAIIDPTRTMLGSRQLADFKAWLLAHKDAAKVVVSPVGWHSIGRTQEDWSNYKYEQDQIAAYAAANNIRNTVVLCGDMHACAWDSGNNTAASWPVMHAAPWHQTASHKGGTYDKGEIPAPPDTSLVEQFGLLSFTDTGGDDISLTFSARDATNTLLFSDSVMTFTDVEGVSSTVETLAPVATRNITSSMTPNTDPAATAAVDDDPDASDGVLIANSTDPSGSSGSTNNNYADASEAASGIATQLTNAANAVGSSEASNSASLGVLNTDWATFFKFAETANPGIGQIPDNAVINSFNATLRDSITNTTRGTVGVRFDTTNGTQLAAENTTSPPTSLPLTGTGRTVTPAALPTVAQLKSSAFGVRVRFRKTASQTVTYTLDWIRLNISYTTPGSTVNTHVELIMANPVGTLATGADTGFVKVRVAKRGTGPNPTCSVRVMEFMGGTTWTERAAPASMTNVAVAGGAVLSGFFDQLGITNKDNVEVWIDGTGTAGALVEFDGARWDATMAAGTTFTVTHNATATVVATHSKQVQVTRTRTSAPAATHVKQPQKIHAIAEAAAASYARQLQALRTHNATATGTGTHTKQPQVKRTATETATATATASKVVLRTHNATSTVIATAQRTVQIIRNATEAATATHSRQARVARAVQEAAIATHAASKVVLRSHNATAAVIATATRQAQLRRLAQEAAVGTASQQITARRSHNATAVGAGSATRQARIARARTSTPVGTYASTKVILRVHNATVAPVATALRQVQARRLVAVAPTATDQIQARIARAVQAALVATHIKEPRIARSRTSVPVGAHTSSKVIQRSHASVATGLATSSRAVKVSHNALAVPTPTERLTAQIRRQALAVAQPSHTPAVTLTIAHSATSLPLAAHALMPGVSYYAQVIAAPTYAYLVQAAIATIPRVGPTFTDSGDARVRVTATPRASVGNEGDYGGAGIYPGRRVRIT